MPKRKIVLFGGTFDPIHLGHTIVVKEAGEFIGAEKIIFIPAKCSPLKKNSPLASDRDRFKMIDLAIGGVEKFEVSDYELNKPRPSYTLDTIRYFQARFGDEVSIYWLLGADCIEELSGWYRIDDLIDECNLCLMLRAGYEKPDFSKFEKILGHKHIAKLQQNIIETSLIDISSTEIRRRLAGGLDVSDMLNPDVAEYIRKNKLYK